ncbi:hypothetical protein BKA70DRAFT_1222347 [Coprinopsis sp. MPI-PUGE-AT-0042]|nr:hypothetical protein BKA70DRAFT_1222347 [Coprinopsis sp. MPI-PUGE-AT-0042]
MLAIYQAFDASCQPNMKLGRQMPFLSRDHEARFASISKRQCREAWSEFASDPYMCKHTPVDSLSPSALDYPSQASQSSRKGKEEMQSGGSTGYNNKITEAIAGCGVHSLEKPIESPPVPAIRSSSSFSDTQPGCNRKGDSELWQAEIAKHARLNFGGAVLSRYWPEMPERMLRWLVVVLLVEEPSLCSSARDSADHNLALSNPQLAGVFFLVSNAASQLLI